MVDEFLEEKPKETVDLRQYFEIVRRRFWYFLIPFFLGWVLVWTASWVLPARYRSGTLILVEQPSMPKDYVTPNVTDDLQNRLQSITQQILSRTRLLRIIDQLNLYPKAKNRPTDDDLVQTMRKNIEIELVRDRDSISAFNVYYSADDPHVAQQVTTELTNLFISENLEVRQQQSEDTTKFLQARLEESRKALTDQEQRIKDFKGQHVGDLPGQLQSNLTILNGLQTQLQTAEDGLNTAKQQNIYLQSLFNQYRSLQRSYKSSDGSVPVGLPAIDQELDRLRAQLADLSSHYTERHPDIRKLKEQIARTEATRQQILNNLKSNHDSATDVQASDVKDTSPILQVQSQLQANQVEIANRERSIAALKVRINDYQTRLNQEPVREQQLADLTRGYDQLKQTYDDLLKKKNQSEMATSMELLQQGEHFKMIDPPSLPAKPDFPNHVKFCGIALAVGLALGFVVAGGAEFLDDRIHSEKVIKALLPVAVIGEIPRVNTPDEDRSQSKNIWAAWAAASVVIMAVSVGSAISFFRG